jgi:PAS domain S-box-containing protein
VAHPAPDAQQTLLRLLIDSVKDYAIFVLDRDGVVRSWNPGAERLKGYRADEIVGQHFSRFYTEGDRADRLPWRALEAARSNGHFQAEGWRVRNDGRQFWADVTITPLYEDGELVGFAKVTRDLTNRKRAEDALIDAVDREREANARLQALDAMKDELVAVVAHELRGPIGIVRGFADLLLADWETLPDEQKLGLVQRISARAKSLSLLVEDIFDVARLEAGQLRVDLEPTDLATLVVRLVEDSRAALPGRRIEVHVDDDLPLVRADEQRAWQVLNNLVTNAVKFSPVDSVVDVDIRRDGDEVAVLVHDRGPGIPDDQADLLFERFSRLPQSSSVPGSGMGLYIARGLAEAQGGRVEASNRAGGGATFRFSLPVAG